MSGVIKHATVLVNAQRTLQQAKRHGSKQDIKHAEKGVEVARENYLAVRELWHEAFNRGHTVGQADASVDKWPQVLA